jgi:hypothetical protein
MYGIVKPGETQKISLGSGDLTGVQSLYPSESTPPESTPPESAS